MQGILYKRNGFKIEDLFSYKALAHPIFENHLFSQGCFMCILVIDKATELWTLCASCSVPSSW